MARTPSTKSASKSVSTPAGSTALSTLDSQLAQEVATIRDAIGGPAGNAIKIKPTGDFVLPDGAIIGNQIQVVVLDFVSKNFLYTERYDPNNPSPPACFAVGKNIAAMVPVKEAPDPQSENCASCPMNAFGSGENGKSKACKNTRELAVLLVEDDGSHNAPDAPIYTLSLSPTNMRSFDSFVSNCVRTLGGPPIKAIVTLSGENVGTYASITCSDMVPNPNYAEHFMRRSEADVLLTRLPDFTPRQAPARNNKPAARRVGNRR